MAVRTIVFLLLALAILRVELSTGFHLNGKVSCLDCESNYDFSGIMVMLKCEHVKKVATTDQNGHFKEDIPLNSPMTNHGNHPTTCLAKLLGGPNQLYASRKNMAAANVIKLHNSASYTISSPLYIHTSCPMTQKNVKCKASEEFGPFGSSKTIDLPLPREWGFAPTSYYVPFFPIIGIP